MKGPCLCIPPWICCDPLVAWARRSGLRRKGRRSRRECYFATVAKRAVLIALQNQSFSAYLHSCTSISALKKEHLVLRRKIMIIPAPLFTSRTRRGRAGPPRPPTWGRATVAWRAAMNDAVAAGLRPLNNKSMYTLKAS